MRDDNLTTSNAFPDVNEDYWPTRPSPPWPGWASSTAATPACSTPTLTSPAPNSRPSAPGSTTAASPASPLYGHRRPLGGGRDQPRRGAGLDPGIQRRLLPARPVHLPRPGGDHDQPGAVPPAGGHGRSVSGMNTWTDCHESDWFYLAIQEATNSHDFVTKDWSMRAGPT